MLFFLSGTLIMRWALSMNLLTNFILSSKLGYMSIKIDFGKAYDSVTFHFYTHFFIWVLTIFLSLISKLALNMFLTLLKSMAHMHTPWTFSLKLYRKCVHYRYINQRLFRDVVLRFRTFFTLMIVYYLGLPPSISGKVLNL